MKPFCIMQQMVCLEIHSGLTAKSTAINLMFMNLFIIIQILQKCPTRCNCVGKFINPLFLKCSTRFKRYYRSKHVEQLRNNGLINFPTQVHIVAHFYKIATAINLMTERASKCSRVACQGIYKIVRNFMPTVLVTLA